MSLRRPWLPIVPLVLIVAANPLPMSEVAHWVIIAVLLAAAVAAGVWVHRGR
ncbi:hypothetical protein [Streptomyces olivaceiscleroticus]|uniref:Uncharacterized protein n=1 Tax=Streptomyces olivaceiscleroticus TaxID=68245 RepID=A0ABP3JHY9_9ACTN